MERPVPITSMKKNGAPDKVINNLAYNYGGSGTKTLEEYDARTGQKRPAETDAKNCNEEKKSKS